MDRCRLRVSAAVAAPDKPTPAKRAEGHSALLQGLGRLGDVSPSHMPWLLRLAHIRHAAEQSQFKARPHFRADVSAGAYVYTADSL